MNSSFGLFNLAGLIPLSAALLWSVNLVYRRRSTASDDTVRLILISIAWIMLVVGLGGVILGAGGPVMVPMMFIVAVVMVMAVRRYRDGEQQMLLWTITVAAEKNIPLPNAVRAFADERSDEMGVRALRLAELLDQGTPLVDALRRSKHRLPTDAELAIRMAVDNGSLGSSLRAAIDDSDSVETTLRSMFDKYAYLFFVVAITMQVLMFMMIAIIPIFREMFDDFGLALPAPTELVCGLSDMFIVFWPLFNLLLFAIMLLGALYYMGLLPRDLPLANRFCLRVDGAVIMRSLALAARQNRPIAATMRQLAGSYPKRSVARRLAMAANAIDSGRPWRDSLRQAGLIRQADAAVLQAAQRVGNLAWALDEMADSAVRRLIYRLRASLNVVFPLVLLGLGLVVLFIFVGIFMPLVGMISGLS